MNTKIIELYDLFRTDLKLDDNRARICSETFILAVKETVELQQAGHKSELKDLQSELKVDNLNKDKKFDNLKTEIELLRVEMDKKIDNLKTEIELLRAAIAINFAEFKVQLKNENTKLFYLILGLVVACIGLIVTIIIKIF